MSCLTQSGDSHFLIIREIANVQTLSDFFWYGLAGIAGICLIVGIAVILTIRQTLRANLNTINLSTEALVAGGVPRSLPTRNRLHLINTFARAINSLFEQLAARNAHLADDLRRANELHAFAMDASGSGFWDWNIATDQFYASPRMLQLFGLSPEASFKSWPQFFDQIPFQSADRLNWESILGKHFADKGNDWFEHELRWIFHSEICWILLRGHVCRGPSGEMLRWSGSATEISGRKVAEAVHRRNEAYLAEAQKLSGTGSFSINIESRELNCSRQAMWIAAFEPGTMPTYEEVLQRVHPDDRERVGGLIERGLLDRSLLEFEHRLLLPDGVVKYVHVVAHTLQISPDNLEFVGAVKDITEQKKSQIELSMARARFEGILAIADDAIVSIDSSQRIVLFNQGAEKVFGYKHAEVIGKSVDLLLPERFEATHWTHVKLFAESGETARPMGKRIEIFGVRKNGQEFPAEASISKLDLGGELIFTIILRDITERKTMEEALHRSEMYFSEAQKLSHTGSFSWYPSSGEVTWSDEVYRVFEVSMDVKPSMGLTRQKIHPDDMEFFLSKASGIPLQEEDEFSYEHRLLFDGNRVKKVRVIGRTIRDDSKKIVQVVGALMDVTDHYEAQQSLECALQEMVTLKEQFELVINTIPGLVWSSLPDGYIDFLNLRWRNYTGLSHAQAEGWGWQVAIHPDDIEGLVKYWKSLLVSGQAGEAEARLRRFDGEYRWFLFRGVPLHDETGTLIKWYGTNTDIEDFKRAEALIFKEKYLLEMIARSETLPTTLNALCLAMEEVTYGALCSIVQMGDDGVIKTHTAAPNLPESFISELDYFIIAKQPCPCTSSIVSTELVIVADVQSDQRWTEQYGALMRAHGLRAVWAAPIMSKVGKVLGIFVIYFREPKSPNSLEYGIIEQFTHLASIAIGRSLEEDVLRLSERRLRQAHSLETVGTLAGGIAHDFNNILGAILGYGEMALRDIEQGTRLHRDLDKIVTAGERGRALIERILTFSRSSVTEKIAVNVEQVTREVLDLAVALLPRSVTIEAELHSGKAAMLGDPTQVHQVLMNLVTNSFQAMPNGGTLRVFLGVVHFDEPRPITIGTVSAGDYIVVEVADSGTGIAPRILDRIFDPFFTTKDVTVGTGLGLSLVHGIVTEVGGSIDVVSVVGVGSSFTVYLPRFGDTDDGQEQILVPPRGNQERILLVEDDELLIKLQMETLEELNYLPVGFSSSVAALEAFLADSNQFDVVITDERMPDVSGSALIHEIRSINRMIPIILVSGYTGGIVMSRAYNEGASEVLKKPLSALELAKSLARVLQDRRSNTI